MIQGKYQVQINLSREDEHEGLTVTDGFDYIDALLRLNKFKAICCELNLKFHFGLFLWCEDVTRSSELSDKDD